MYEGPIRIRAADWLMLQLAKAEEAARRWQMRVHSWRMRQTAGRPF